MRCSFTIALLALALVACGEKPAERPVADRGDTRSVFAVNYPLAYMAERIGGPDVTVTFPVPGDVDPAFWSPDVEDVAGFQQADRILLNGARYARWIERVTLPGERLVDTSAGFRERLIAVEGAPVHTHGPAGEHSHGELAFTTWLDPRLAVEHARAIRDAFVLAWPDLTPGFDERLAALERDLADLDAQLEAAFAGHRGAALLGSHPVYQYLAARYGLDLRSVHWEPEEDPGDAGWRELRRLLAERPAVLMLWEGTPLESVAAALRAAGVEPVVFAPCANVPAGGDWLDVMRANAQAIADAGSFQSI